MGNCIQRRRMSKSPECKNLRRNEFDQKDRMVESVSNYIYVDHLVNLMMMSILIYICKQVVFEKSLWNEFYIKGLSLRIKLVRLIQILEYFFIIAELKNFGRTEVKSTLRSKSALKTNKDRSAKDLIILRS